MKRNERRSASAHGAGSQRKTEQREAQRKADLDSWVPKTDLGKKVKNGEITSVEDILTSNKRILESPIVDLLIPNLETELLSVGQSKGKFGGGKKSIWKQTQKKTKEGNKPKFAALIAVGNRNGYIGIGYGKAKETLPAREKAIRNAKLNLISVRRGSGSWASGAQRAINSIPFAVEGKNGSVTIKLMPAPQGAGLVINKECRKVLALAGIKDVYSKTRGTTHTAINVVLACFDALKKLNKFKLTEEQMKQSTILEGPAV